MKTAMVLVADGTEEMEAVIVIDILRRAQWEVAVAAVGPNLDITASRGVQLKADIRFEAGDAGAPDILILPGGAGGTTVFCTTEHVLDALRRRHAQSAWIAAICAAPLALQYAGILDTHRFTCHPAVRDKVSAGRCVDERVVTDRNLITSQGPGTTFEFALEILRQVDGSHACNAARAGLILPEQLTG